MPPDIRFAALVNIWVCGVLQSADTSLTSTCAFDILYIDYANNIKMDLQKVGWGDTSWNDVVQNRDKRQALVNAIINLQVL